MGRPRSREEMEAKREGEADFDLEEPADKGAFAFPASRIRIDLTRVRRLV